MGVYIKGMEMPKSCPCKLIGDGYDMYCSFTSGIPSRMWEYVECCEKETRPDWCPLGEVPTPRGRMIDADALIEDLERQCKQVFRIDAVSPDDYWITRNEAYNEALWKSWVESFGEYLKTRPTIIEAEE